ncbi:hypothetical protein ACH4K1_19295, partial [Streptomyces sp. NPDC017448]
KGFVVDGVWGTVKGLGTLVGVDGWESMKQAWGGLGNLATGVVLTVTAPHVLWLTPEKHLPGFVRDARNAMKETGKALIAYDQWGENPARAGGAVTFNVLTTVFTGGAGGGVSGAGKAAAAAKALSFANKAGRVVDPTTYLFTGAGAGLTRISDVMTGLKNTGHIEIPPLPPGVVTLPEGGFKFGDGTLHLPPGATVPESAFEIPRGSVKLPAGAEIPTGAVDLGDGIVHLPEGMTPPAGSLPIQEGALKLPEGTTALPEGTARGIDDHGNVIHLDRQGNILSEDGTLKQHHTSAHRGPRADGGSAAAEQLAPVGHRRGETPVGGVGLKTLPNDLNGSKDTIPHSYGSLDPAPSPYRPEGSNTPVGSREGGGPDGHGGNADAPPGSQSENFPSRDTSDMGTRRDYEARTAPESRIPHPPSEPGDLVLSTGDHVYFREGRTGIGYDTSTMVNFDLVRPLDGYHDVVVHGNAQGFFEPGRVNAAGQGFSAGDTHPTHIAEAIRANPSYHGGPVRLVSCHTGNASKGALDIPAAQAIANELGVPVSAPTNKVGVSSRLGPGQVPVIFGGGYWRIFLPMAH